jgi:drug/metabolite transporter (DMT)-like permease
MSRAGVAPASHLVVFAAAGAAVVMWGGTPVVTKTAIAEIAPHMVGLMRTVLPAVIIVPLVLALRFGLPMGRWGCVWLLLSALGGFIMFPILFAVGIHYTSASHAGLILAMLPVFTGLMALALERRWPRLLWWLGVAIAGVGTAALMVFRLGWAGGEDSLLGDFIVLASGVGASAGYVSGARLSQLGYSAWGTTFWGIVAGGSPALRRCRGARGRLGRGVPQQLAFDRLLGSGLHHPRLRRLVLVPGAGWNRARGAVAVRATGCHPDPRDIVFG